MIMLGNLTIDQMQRRTGVTFPDELVTFMESPVNNDLWHCYDLPFMLLCGDTDTAQSIYDYLKESAPQFKEKMQISVEETNDENS